jgi:hypothetical protein
MPTNESALEPVNLAFAEPVPAGVPVGSLFRAKIVASCASGSDLSGAVIKLVASAETIASVTLNQQIDGPAIQELVAMLVAKAPARVGEFIWTVLFPAQEIHGRTYPENALPMSFRTRPHRTSLAVWDVPAPVVIGEKFAVKVGAKSSGACGLAGAKVEILDAAGNAVAHGTLGHAALPGTDALYWTEIALTAPAREGTFSWTAAFAAFEPELPHSGCAAAFSIVGVKPPAHRLIIKVIEDPSLQPVADAQVGVGPYRGATDANGLADIAAAAGRYELAVWKSGFAAAPVAIEMREDTHIEIALTPLPKELTVWD